MSCPAEHFITADDYLVLERQAESKSEYLNGCIYAMSGASRNHNRITINLGALLHTQLRGKPCEPFVNDMRVKVSPTGL
ncbi:MAG TPA: Uma2 family endonuclease, partial [Candidatus Competibacteraceae bacterium]|nr:Uma2 family endonuclease [Candidatus Competibacteraceae bacterium]